MRSIYVLFMIICSMYLVGLYAENTIKMRIVTHANGKAFQIEGTDFSYADFSKPITIKNIDASKTEFEVKGEDVVADKFDKNDNSVTFKVENVQLKEVEIRLTAKNVDPYPLTILALIGVPAKTEVDSNVVEKGPFISMKMIDTLNVQYSHYDVESNVATYLFDMNGQLWGPAPVNVDADDYIDVYLIVTELNKQEYTISVSGEYKPTDFAMRSYNVDFKPFLNGTGLKTKEGFTYLYQRFGPFTSDQVMITIIRKGAKTQMTPYPVSINKLYHSAVGVSFISTNLQKPSFVLEPLTATTNTINKVDNSSRSMAMVNVVFYWKASIDWVKGKLEDKSITRGRDILKEASFWERFNPTFGVPISKEWDKNMFFGMTLEFSRGGSFIAGGHYGDFQQLANRQFKLGEDEFSGTKEDIQLSTVYGWSGFIGISVDTRILSVLFSK